MFLRRFILAGALLPALTMSAQNFRGGVAGTVTDSTGAVVPAVNLKLTSVATQTVLNSASSSAGLYQFPELPVGVYQLTASAPGFSTVTVHALIVEAGRTVEQPISLAVSSTESVVNVTANSLTLDTDDTSQTSIITPKTMENVPLNGRDFTQLLKLVPGYSNPGNLAGSLNGSRTNSIDWQIDGVDNNDIWFNTYSVNQGGEAGIAATLLPIDSIEELSVQAQGGVETGRTSAGTANAVLKTGTNTTHGSLYYFNRNEDLSRANWFGPNVPKIRDQEFGGSVGGPVIKDNTFYFLSYEQQKLTVGHDIQDTVPSPAWVTLATGLLKARNVPVNSVSTNLLTFYPGMGNAPATINNYFTTEPDQDTSYNGLVKLDHTFHDQSTLSLHWFGGSGKQVAYNGSALAAFYQTVPSRMNNIAAVYHKNISPNFTTQTLLGANFYLQGYYDVDTNFNPIAAGLNTGVTQQLGSPDIAINDFTEIGLTDPSRRYQWTGHLTENDNYLRGKHEFHFGGEYRHAVVNVAYHRSQRGSFSFNGQLGPNLTQLSANDAWDANAYLLSQGYSAASAGTLTPALNSLSDFLEGNVPEGGANIVYGNVDRRYMIDAVSFYGGDSWKATPKLTLNYGLYWNFTGPMKDPTNEISTFLPQRGGFVFTGHGIKTVYPGDFGDLAPRVGFSYQPKAGGKWVIRGAWGIYYQTPNYNYFSDNRPRDNNSSYGVQYNPYLYSVPGSPNTNVQTYSSSSPFTIVSGQPIFSGAGSTNLGGFSIDQNFRNGYAENINTNVEYQINHSTLLEVGYVGSESHRLPVTLEINQIPLGGNTAPGDLNNALRPYYTQFPLLQGIDQVESAASANYNSMIVSLRTNNWHNFDGNLSYTWGHSLDDISGARGSLPENSYNLKGDWGNSDVDTRQVLGAYLSYAVPYPAAHKRLLGGLRMNTWVTSFTGVPFTVHTNEDVSLTGQYNDRVNVVGNPLKAKGQDTPNSKVSWFNPYICGSTGANGVTVTNNCFAEPALGTYGNEARNKFHGPGLNEVDFSVFKNTAITQRIDTQFRVEIFNLFNVRNLSGPDSGLNDGPGSFGYITSTPSSGGAPGIGLGEPFNVQLALKIMF